MTGGPGGGASADEVTAKILEAASALFAAQGPDSVTIKWIGLESGVSPDEVSARWPDVPAILGAVLQDIAVRFDRLQLLPKSEETALTRVALTDRYQQIVARALLDGLNPATLQSEFPVMEGLVRWGVSARGIDERSARYRISQIYALEWGWRLFGEHLLTACGLEAESVEDQARELLALQDAISRLPPVDPAPDQPDDDVGGDAGEQAGDEPGEPG
jgi:AcrR family transcriptional regulator